MATRRSWSTSRGDGADHFAVLQHGDAVGDREHFGQAVRDEHDGRAARAQLAAGSRTGPRISAAVERRGRLVEDQHRAARATARGRSPANWRFGTGEVGDRPGAGRARPRGGEDCLRRRRSIRARSTNSPPPGSRPKQQVLARRRGPAPAACPGRPSRCRDPRLLRPADLDRPAAHRGCARRRASRCRRERASAWICRRRFRRSARGSRRRGQSNETSCSARTPGKVFSMFSTASCGAAPPLPRLARERELQHSAPSSLRGTAGSRGRDVVRHERGGSAENLLQFVVATRLVSTNTPSGRSGLMNF